MEKRLRTLTAITVEPWACYSACSLYLTLLTVRHLTANCISPFFSVNIHMYESGPHYTIKNVWEPQVKLENFPSFNVQNTVLTFLIMKSRQALPCIQDFLHSNLVGMHDLSWQRLVSQTEVGNIFVIEQLFYSNLSAWCKSTDQGLEHQPHFHAQFRKEMSLFDSEHFVYLNSFISRMLLAQSPQY